MVGFSLEKFSYWNDLQASLPVSALKNYPKKWD